MFPVEPRPVIIATIEAPSRDSVAAGLRFFPKMPAAFSPEGANKLLAAPIAARNERRLQPNFIANPLSTDPAHLLVRSRSGRIHNSCTADDLNQGIPRNPFDRHASAGGSLAGGKIGSVDLVQRVVLRLVGIKPGFAGWR